MIWRRMSTGIGCVCAALAVAGCATPGYSPDRVQSELIRAGTTRAQAQCVTDGLTNTFDTTQLGSHSPPHAGGKKDEFVLTRKILKKCGVTLALIPPP